MSLASCDLLLHVVSYLLIYKGKFLLPFSLKNGRERENLNDSRSDILKKIREKGAASFLKYQ